MEKHIENISYWHVYAIKWLKRYFWQMVFEIPWNMKLKYWISTPSRFITIFQQIFSPCISKKNQVPENEKHFDLKPKFNIVFVIWYSFDRFVCCSFYMLCIWYIHFTMYINFHVWIIILYISEECFFCVYMNKVKKIQTCNMSFFSM